MNLGWLTVFLNIIDGASVNVVPVVFSIGAEVLNIFVNIEELSLSIKVGCCVFGFLDLLRTCFFAIGVIACR